MLCSFREGVVLLLLFNKQTNKTKANQITKQPYYGAYIKLGLGGTGLTEVSKKEF